MQKEFLQGQLFGDDAIGIVDGASAHFVTDTCLLDIAQQDGIVAYHPDYFIHHVALRQQGCRRHQYGRKY